MIRSHNVLFGLGKGFCENYNHNHNKNKEAATAAQREYNEFSMIYPPIYSNLMISSANAFYTFKESYMPYNYSYGAFVNSSQYNNYGNLVSDLNMQSLNLQQMYNPSVRNGKMMKNWRIFNFQTKVKMINNLINIYINIA